MSADRPKKILVVDDELDIIDMLESLLDSEGYAVIKAASGAKALAALAQAPDLVLLDIMMPDMDGHRVLEEIRKKCDMSALPVLMVTARNDVVDIGRALDSGANGFVVKPFDTENLLRTVRGILEKNPVAFYANYERVDGVTARSGTGYQQGERIIFLDLMESDPEADVILDALNAEGVYLMSILQFDAAKKRRQSSVLLTAENGMCFGVFLNRLLKAGSITITACQIYKDHLDLPHDLMAQKRDYRFEE